MLGLLTGTAATLLAAALGARSHPYSGSSCSVTPRSPSRPSPAPPGRSPPPRAEPSGDGYLVNRIGELSLTRSTALALLLLTFAAPAAAVIASWPRAELLDSDPRNLANISLAHDETLITHKFGPTPN